MEERLSLSFQRPVYVPAEPDLPFSAVTPDEESIPTIDIARKARVAPN
jgi:hypothetical protein